MDIASSIFDSGVLPSTLPEQKNKTSDTEAAKIKFSKDFESVFINKLLDEMKNTIGNWGEEKDGASQQIDGIFWLHLGRELADKGGLGMWKNIYESLNKAEQKNSVPELLDKKL